MGDPRPGHLLGGHGLSGAIPVAVPLDNHYTVLKLGSYVAEDSGDSVKNVDYVGFVQGTSPLNGDDKLLQVLAGKQLREPASGGSATKVSPEGDADENADFGDRSFRAVAEKLAEERGADAEVVFSIVDVVSLYG